MKLRLTAAAVALSALASVAQAEVVAPSFIDSAPLESAPNVSDTVIVKQIPQRSFNDGANVQAQAVTGSRAVQNEVPKFNGSALGGPTGPATVLLQSEQPEALRQTLVAPSFNG